MSGLRNGNRKFFRFTKWKLEILRFPFRKTELSRNSDLRNKFPDHSISKMEIFFRKNGNPSSKKQLSETNLGDYHYSVTTDGYF